MLHGAIFTVFLGGLKFRASRQIHDASPPGKNPPQNRPERSYPQLIHTPRSPAVNNLLTAVNKSRRRVPALARGPIWFT